MSHQLIKHDPCCAGAANPNLFMPSAASRRLLLSGNEFNTIMIFDLRQ
uniref:Uncharacterized protein n=1 Tax=Arundo donax TaxID=35708 RepID=A0A0A9E3Y7_ARUDO